MKILYQLRGRVIADMLSHILKVCSKSQFESNSTQHFWTVALDEVMV